MTITAAETFRDYVTDGVPASGAHAPLKVEIREWGLYIESLITTVAGMGGRVYATKTQMDADTAPAINTPCVITADGANTGLWRKTAATGSAGATKLLDFVPGAQLVTATDGGAGTPNAIVCTSSSPVSTTAGAQIVTFAVFEANTGTPVTVAFNGGTALTIKTATGSDLPIGGLVAGMTLVGVVGASNTFRLWTDYASAANQELANAARIAAEAAATLAQGYAATAAAAGSFYADTAAALADSGLAVGSYFLIPSATVGGYADLYLKAAGPVATFISTYLNGGVRTPGPAAAGLTDSAGAPLFFVSPTRIVSPAFQAVETIANRGLSRAQLRDLKAALGTITPPTFDRRYGHIVLDGQSLATGTSGHACDAAPGPWAFQFIGGITSRATGAPADTRDSFVALDNETGTSISETGAPAVLRMIQQLLLAENGFDLARDSKRFIVSSTGEGSTSILENALGTTNFGWNAEDATAAKAILDAALESYQALAVIWRQGEKDNTAVTTQANYLSRITALQTDLTASLRAVDGLSGQALPLFTYQVASHLQTGYINAGATVALAQLQAATSIANIVMTTPTYMMPYQADGVHMMSKGYVWLGAYEGLAIKRFFWDGVKERPVYPLSATRAGRIVTLKYAVDPGCELVFDTALVAAQTNMGFTAVDSGGSALTISSVRITGHDTVEVLMSATAPAGMAVRYGFVNTTGGARGCGNLKAVTGIVYDPDGFNLPLDAWAAISSTTVA